MIVRILWLVAFSLGVMVGAASGAAVLSSPFDFIDDFFSAGGGAQGPTKGLQSANQTIFSMTYDIFDWNNGTPQIGEDGKDDLRLTITTMGLGPAAGAYVGDTYNSNVFLNGTGLRSELSNTGSNVPNSNPTPTSGMSGIPGAEFGGLNTLTQTIEFRFLNGMSVTVDDLSAASWSSSNTIAPETNAFEWSAIQLLDVSYMPFSTIPAVNYVEERDNATSGRWIGAGTKIAIGDTQDEVGNSDATSNSASGLNDDTLDFDGEDAIEEGLPSGTLLGGFIYAHNIIDTRGTNDSGGFEYSNTVNELQFSRILVAVPEPTAWWLMVGCGMLIGFRTWAKRVNVLATVWH